MVYFIHIHMFFFDREIRDANCLIFEEVDITFYTLTSIMSHHPFHQKVCYKQGVTYRA